MSEAGAEGLVEELQGDIARLHDALIGAEWHGDEAARQRDVWKHRAETAEAALEAQGRALAEAGAENKRLSESRFRWSRRYFEAAGASLIAERQRDEALEALRPFAEQADTHNEQFPDAMFIDDYERQKGEPWRSLAQITLGDLRRARSVLENGPADLADANQSKSPSSQDQEIAGLREELRRKDEALRNVRGLIDTPVARRKHHNDPFYEDVIASLRSALSPLDGEA